MEKSDWWDAETYSRLSLPHMRWGEELLRKLDVGENATVLEIGCGTGRDTEKLAQRLPRGRVVAIDRSARQTPSVRAGKDRCAQHGRNLGGESPPVS